MLYTRSFLKSLKKKALAKLGQYPGLYDRDAVLAARTLYEFDNVRHRAAARFSRYQ